VASIPIPLLGRGVARHVLVGMLMDWDVRREGDVNAGRVAYCAAIDGVVKIAMPRPLLKAVGT
jgi:hypothetical protein